MPVVVKKSKSKEGAVDVQLAVEVSGMTITAKAGTFKWAKTDHTIAEDIEFEATADSEQITTALGYLVLDGQGDPGVFVMEQLWDDEEMFDLGSSEYDPIMLLFRVQIPAGATTLEDLSVVVGQLVPVSMAQEGGE